MIRGWMAAFGIGLAVTCAAGATECSSLRPQARQAVEAGDLPAAKALYADVRNVCDAAFVDAYGRRVAALLFAAATAGDVPDERALLEALQYGRPWQVLATLGDIESGRKDWSGAARHYQEALTEINNPVRTPQQPAADIIRMVFKKAETTGLLASEYVPTVRDVNGANGGLALSAVRGVAIAKVALPVQFVFRKADMTDAGLAAAKDMAAFLKNDKTLSDKGIVLVGHTDPIGADAFNRALSRQRAEAVADYLRANGVTVRIATDGKGKDQPFEPDQASKYTQDELYQMDRRVELIRQ